MTARTVKLLAVAVLLGLLLPRGDAAPEPVPATSRAPCCNVADAPPPPISTGDEDFFSIQSGVPNVMILLDNSGSMIDLPRRSRGKFPIQYPSPMPATGTCSLPDTSPLAKLSAARTNTPYDSGYKTYYSPGNVALDDTPAWTTACTTTTPPTGDRVTDPCLFRPTSYYKFYDQSPMGMGLAGATVYNGTPSTDAAGVPTSVAGPCAAVDGGGRFANDLPELVAMYATCTACLRDKGYFLFRHSGDNKSQAVIRGDLLNVYPDNPLVTKALTARKLLKDTIKLDPQSASPADVVRFGLALTTGGDADKDCANNTVPALASGMRDGDGARLLVPIGPDCDAAAKMTQSEFVAARQQIIDAINDTSGNAERCTGFVNFTSWTPPGEALFNVGQYFAGAEYESRFGKGWMKLSSSDASQNFSETSPGAVNAPWAAAGRNQKAYCNSCQQSSVLIITDGMPTSDGNVPSDGAWATHDAFTPSNDFRSWVKADGSFTAGCSNCAGEVLHKVAAFLSGNDLNATLDRQQSIKTYTVSFGLDVSTNADAIALLDKTAELGGTKKAHITNSDTELKAALDTVISEAGQKMNAFSATSAGSLQTSQATGADAYLGRFKPTSGTIWEGHVYAAQLFDEFAAGCREGTTTALQKTVACGRHPAQNPNMDEDTLANGNARCASAYLVDKNCDPIVEDAAGIWTGTFDPTTHALAQSTTGATPFWDAGRALSDPTDATVIANGSYRSASAADTDTQRRSIWTVIDRNADGLLTAGDGLVEFRPENAAALAPMMSLPAAAQSSDTALPVVSGATPWCNQWLDAVGVCGRSPLPSCGSSEAAVRTKCAEHVIHFYRGWDVADQDGDHCAGPDNYYNTHAWGVCATDEECKKEGVQIATCSSGKCLPSSSYCPDGEQRDRSADHRKAAERDMWKLGDVFHSSPVLVRPPLSKGYCGTGAFNQCVMTLYSALGGNRTATTKLEQYGTRDAYDQWREDNLKRSQIVLVGANDGMLHAFHAGDAIGTTPRPLDGYAHDSGTGAELWAFIPPDMLPRLRHGIDVHTTFVDGSPMVRDVWVDGSGGNPKDGIKQKGEFHTVAVVGERSGGQRFTALDVTDPTSPRFLWTWPQPCSPESKLVGQTWSDFLPRPPPIGPVRLALPARSGQDPLGRGFEERWVALLNGGYDPALVRGRGVFMVDVWTGALLWSFTDADLKRVRGDAKASLFPVPGGVSMVDIGAANARSDAKADSDGYFDTATWGDMGGNLYTARFHAPGTLDPNTGRVTNWTAARSFEQNRQDGDAQLAPGRGPFFYMPTNVLDGPARLVTLAGSGDRENMLSKANSCGARNVLGCCASGCSAGSAATTTSYGSGSCTQGGTFACTGGVMTFTAASASSECTNATGFSCGATAAPTVNAQTDLSFTCGAAGTVSGTSKYAFDANGLVTLDAPVATSLALSTASLGAAVPQYRMFAVWSYGEVASRKFTTEAEAKAFDGNRLTDVPFSGCADMPGTSCTLVETASAQVTTTTNGLETTCRDASAKCWAGSGDPGWMYSYGTYCPTGSCAQKTWSDERSANGVNVALRCADWSSLRPDAGTGTAAPPAGVCGAGRKPVQLSYLVDAVAGVPRASCGVQIDTPVLSYNAARQKTTSAPPTSGMTRMVVNDKGEVSYSTLQTGGPGSAPENTRLGTRSSASETLYWLEVDRPTHVCRHVDGTTCK